MTQRSKGYSLTTVVSESKCRQWSLYTYSALEDVQDGKIRPHFGVRTEHGLMHDILHVCVQSSVLIFGINKNLTLVGVVTSKGIFRFL